MIVSLCLSMNFNINHAVFDLVSANRTVYNKTTWATSLFAIICVVQLLYQPIKSGPLGVNRMDHLPIKIRPACLVQYRNILQKSCMDDGNRLFKTIAISVALIYSDVF